MITVEPGESPVVWISGEVNYDSAPRIRQVFSDLMAQGHETVVLDCADVEFIDSSGIGAIVHAAQALKDAKRHLRLRAAGAQFVHALQVSGLAQMLDLSLVEPLTTERDLMAVALSQCQRYSFSLPASCGTTTVARRRVTEFIEAMPFTTQQLDDIKLAVGEALANAVRHGCSKPDEDCLVVRCSGDSQKFVISINNPGDPFDVDAVPVPTVQRLRDGGMGIFFMRTAMDEVDYAFDQDGTTVTMTKFINGQPSG